VGVFIASSRYSDVKTVEAETESGRTVTAIRLRRLPYVPGTPTVVKGHDRLDVMAQRKFSDGAKFWHIADANTELEANQLVRPRVQDKDVRIINVPEK
jgi:hypothetical protein